MVVHFVQRLSEDGFMTMAQYPPCMNGGTPMLLVLEKIFNFGR